MKHLAFEVQGPTEMCRREGLMGCEPEASGHYDAMLGVIQEFVEHLPRHLQKAAPIC